MLINPRKSYAYRITHIRNLPLVLQNGIVSGHHPKASAHFIRIGDEEIIAYRDTEDVRLQGYGRIGEYVPFYFTPRSPMLYIIISGRRAPRVPKRDPSEILVIRCLITQLCACKQWFFTNAQGNSAIAKHFDDIADLEEIDWNIIQHSDFKKTDADIDKPRRYQAEFLVRNEVPIACVESLHVFDEKAAEYVRQCLIGSDSALPVRITPEYFF